VGLTAEQLEFRRQGVGSSEIAVVAGVSPFKTRPIDLYCLKLGLTEPEPETPEMAAGSWLEGPIRDRYARETGREVRLPQDVWPDSVNGTVRHARVPWAMATPDGLVMEGGRPARIVECKNVGSHMARHWRDEPDGVPDYYRCQVQWQMEVCDLPGADVAALIGGQSFRVYAVERDRELGALLLRVAEKFWVEHVLAGVPPVETCGDALAYLAARYPRATEPAAPACEEAEAWARKLARARRARRRVDALADVAEAKLKELIGARAGLEGGWWKARWVNRKAPPKWKAVALELGATETQVERSRGSGTRAFDFDAADSREAGEPGAE
jgi:putative phage-type endonuclease